MVLYSTLVPSLRSVMATHCSTKIGFLTTNFLLSTGCNSAHKYTNVSLLTLKLRFDLLFLQVPTMSGKRAFILVLAQECLSTTTMPIIQLECHCGRHPLLIHQLKGKCNQSQQRQPAASSTLKSCSSHLEPQNTKRAIFQPF